MPSSGQTFVPDFYRVRQQIKTIKLCIFVCFPRFSWPLEGNRALFRKIQMENPMDLKGGGVQRPGGRKDGEHDIIVKLHSGHWKATRRILGNFLWKILYKNLDLKGGPPAPVPPPLRCRFLYRIFHKKSPRIHPIAFQWPV